MNGFYSLYKTKDFAILSNCRKLNEINVNIQHKFKSLSF